MEKRRKWQLFLILAVIGLTIYNILPTVFYYCKPLKSPITENQATQIAMAIEKRVQGLQKGSKEWLSSFCELLHLKPQSISEEGQTFVLRFTKTEEAARFRTYLPKAGSLIPFLPAQLSLAPQEESVREVRVQTGTPFLLQKTDFSFAPQGSPLYQQLVLDRAAQIALALTGPSQPATILSSLESKPSESLEALALQIESIGELSKIDPALANRYAASFTQGSFSNRPTAIKTLISHFDQARDALKKEPSAEKKLNLLSRAENFLKKHEALFSAGLDPWDLSHIQTLLKEKKSLKLGNRNPLFSDLSIDGEKGEILLQFHPGIHPSEVHQLVIDEVAKISHLTHEKLLPREQGYATSLHAQPDATGFLVVDLQRIGQLQAQQISTTLKTQWHPQHPDLKEILITDATTYETLAPEEKALAIVIHAPSETNPLLFASLPGIDALFQNYQAMPDSEPAQTFLSDIRSLIAQLGQEGLHGYRTAHQELVFIPKSSPYSFLAATREQFEIKGTQRYATLELSNLEQRLLVENRIDTAIHEDLVKWRDEYNAAQVSLHSGVKFEVPKPTRSPFLSNILLSWTKFFRGDERKVIRWGLDLSGGKTVQIELRDANHQLVTGEEELKQGINELYQRVNKMGVSEVSIRQLGDQIVLDFPGSQSLSASELIRASSMYFHLVHEKFSSPYSPLASSAQRFLQEVWNEALVTQRTDLQSIQEIAWEHLYGPKPSDTAQTLLEQGLTLASPKDPSMSPEFNDTVSKIALIRGEDWMGQNHPLLFVFNHYALEGSQLDHIQANYDPQKGNYLTFEVQGAAVDRQGQKINPRTQLQNWTSRYCKEKIAGTSLGDYSRGRGWRMAVILNDTVISAPTLEAELRDSASISGSFSQREVHQLATDLKAGSLTFTPHILSEKNVSPELGQKDRTQGIAATAVALLLVIGSMVAYYRFAGLIASIAVLFNLLILWATLQNLGATLSLAGIAGIILTVGMAVDANVLVFERIKEEFAISGKIGSAIAAGYKKAYSAIVDSNVTTIIAAFILLNFDAGPIKGFAITLIIGIASSMFTALFMTRYYFAGWIQNPKHQALKMANWIHAQSIDFLRHTKFAFTLAIGLIVVGSFFVYAKRNTIFGMDFTGGYSLHLELTQEKPLLAVEQALKDRGLTSRDFQIRELNPSHHLRILFGTTMEQPGKPFAKMPLETDLKETRYPFEKNPRIQWVVQTLQAKNISLTEHSLQTLDSHWTAMSGQMSDSMRNNALMGLLISFICIFIYIAIRFEYKFAAAAILCLLHDVLITLGLMGILHAMGVPLQIDLNTVAAIMTIVGYSLNDTIIIFDRIREEMHLTPHRPLPMIVNTALNATLSRTTITSGTTLLVLVALVALGGSSIFSFALVMTLGVFFGTLSSWYIASPLMLLFHHQETKKTGRRIPSS